MQRLNSQAPGPELPRRRPRRLQLLQHPVTPDPPTDPAPVPGRGVSRMGRGHRGCP